MPTLTRRDFVSPKLCGLNVLVRSYVDFLFEIA